MLKDIYQYKNYREHLKDFYNEKKKNNQNYSYALFSRKSGLNSPNYLKRVIDGTRNITHKNLRNFIAGLGLKKKEAKFFENLVMFNQSDKKEDQDYFFGELKKNSQRNNTAFQIDADYYEYLSHWYYVAIHEMVNLKDFKEDLGWICKRLKNKVTKLQIKRALNLLLKLGLLKRNSNGKFTQTHPQIKYLKEIKSLAIQKFHQQMIDLAKDSISHDSLSQREPSSLTVCVKNGDYEDIKKRIEEFRTELNSEYSCQPGMGEDVFQINFQLFSLT